MKTAEEKAREFLSSGQGPHNIHISCNNDFDSLVGWLAAFIEAERKEQDRATREACVNSIECRLDDFCSDHGRHENDTNAFVFDSESAEAYCEGLNDAINIIENTCAIAAINNTNQV